MFTLPKLNYKYADLEPYIDARTMEIHYTKHHQAYVDNLNKSLEGLTNLKEMEIGELLNNINDIPEDRRQSVINHGGGHANHSFFWTIMSPKHSTPEGELKTAIEKEFASVETFKEKFLEKAMGVFGSGWAFLILDKNKRLQLKRHSFQNSPLMDGNIPILGIDVWEHAYYLKYQNRRAEYISAWWNIVNWSEMEVRFNLAIKTSLH